MLIEYIHPNNLPKLQLEIAKPNRNIIGRLPEAFNIEQNIKLGQINELSFTIPYEIEKNFILARNPNVDKLKSRYLVRASFKDQKEWFIISNLNNSFNENGKVFLNVKLYSLGYQLKDKKIRTWIGVYIDGKFRKESLNAQQVLEDLLSGTTWGIDYIDSEFLTKYRSFDFNNTTILDAVFEVARTFGAIIQWNTENKTISLLKQENIGVNKGFRISYGKYLKSLSKEERSDEMITRLRVYGKDGLSIHRVNPLGTDYIEDFSYFMQGFQRDENKNTISSSEYMSDGLCHALLDYQEFVATKEGEFQSLLTQKESLESQRKTKENELSALEMELKQIQDTIDVKQTSGMDASVELQQEQEKLNQIATKEAEIDSLENQINNIDTQIEQLKNSLSIENHFTPDQIIELNDYIIEETWEDQNYYDDVELYNDAKKVFEDLKKPKTIIDIDIVNLFKLIESKNDWDKVQIGDKFYIHYEKFGIDVESQIIEMNINHDDNSISVTIANTVDIEKDEEKLSKILYDSISVKSTIDMSKYKWDQVNNVKTSIDEILEGKWNPATNGINAGVNNTVTIDRRGITVISSDDPNKFVRMTNGVIGFTNDGGNTFKLALDATGVYAEHLVGKITITERLYIENVSGKYTFDQYGMTIDGGSINIVGGLPPEQLDPSFKNSLVELNKDYTNGIRIDTANGLLVTRSDDKVKAIFNATDGFKFQVKEGLNWIDKFYYDVNNSRLVLKGEMDASELKVNGQSVLTTDKLKINGGYIDKIKIEQLDASTAKITTAMIENAAITNAKIDDLAVDNAKIASLDGSKITASSITADKLNVSSLSAISADLGTVTAGTLRAVTLESATGTFSGSLKTSNLTIDSELSQRHKIRLRMMDDSGVNYAVIEGDHTLATGNILEIYRELNDSRTSFDYVFLDTHSLEVNGQLSANSVKTDSVTMYGDSYVLDSYVIKTPDRGWLSPTFLNGWTDFGSKYETAGYYKDALGFIRLKGLIKNGTMGTAAFVLPSGYRPSYRKIFPVLTLDGIGRVNIEPSGDVVIMDYGTASNRWVSLDGIIFNT
jgi:hypothetical protein